MSANIGFAAFHLYTAVIAYQSSGGISAFLTLAMPMLSEIYWCGKPAGMLRVTAPPPAGDFFLASAVPRFLAHYPEISLDLSFTDALTDIVAERFDAGIRIGERIERDMIAVRVTDELPLVVAGSPAYFAQRGKPKDTRRSCRPRLHPYPIFKRHLCAMALSGQTPRSGSLRRRPAGR